MISLFKPPLYLEDIDTNGKGASKEEWRKFREKTFKVIDENFCENEIMKLIMAKSSDDDNGIYTIGSNLLKPAKDCYGADLIEAEKAGKTLLFVRTGDNILHTLSSKSALHSL
jgi:hypothetical protein